MWLALLPLYGCRRFAGQIVENRIELFDGQKSGSQLLQILHGKPVGAGRHHDLHVRAGLAEKSHEAGCLVRRDAARDPE